MSIISYRTLSCSFVTTCSICRSKAQETGPAQSGDDGSTSQSSQSHRDYLTQGSYYLIVAQIDYCLALLKLKIMLCCSTKGVFPPEVFFCFPNNLTSCHFSSGSSTLRSCFRIFFSCYVDSLLFLPRFQVSWFSLDPLISPNYQRPTSTAEFFGKVGAGVRLRHIVRLRSSLKSDRAVCKSSPTRHIVEYAAEKTGARRAKMCWIYWPGCFFSSNTESHRERSLWLEGGFHVSARSSLFIIARTITCIKEGKTHLYSARPLVVSLPGWLSGSGNTETTCIVTYSEQIKEATPQTGWSKVSWS